MVFREGLEGLEEIRVGLKVEESPSRAGDSSGVAILSRKELYFNQAEGALEVSVPLE